MFDYFSFQFDYAGPGGLGLLICNGCSLSFLKFFFLSNTVMGSFVVYTFIYCLEMHFYGFGVPLTKFLDLSSLGSCIACLTFVVAFL